VIVTDTNYSSQFMEDSGFIGLIYIKRIYDELVGYCNIVMCYFKWHKFGNQSYFVRGVWLLI